MRFFYARIFRASISLRWIKDKNDVVNLRLRISRGALRERGKACDVENENSSCAVA